MFWLIPLFAWFLVIALLIAGLVLAIIATRVGRHWLIAPVAALIIVATAIALIVGPGIPPHPIAAIITIAVLVGIGVIGGSPLVIAVLELAGSDKEAIGEHGGILVTEAGSKKPSREILRGGATIGYLERLLIMGAALLGQYAAVAIVVAVKGLGRFNELENAAARERFIIGTLASIVWAGACIAPIVIGAGGTLLRV